jgi:hypothetical protein
MLPERIRDIRCPPEVSMLHYKENPADRYDLYLKELEKE